MQETKNRSFIVPWISEMCILVMISHADSYGYEIIHSNALNMNDSTVYPVLRRLEKTGCLESYSQVSDSKLRKCYRITETGHEQLEKSKEHWAEYKRRIDYFLDDSHSLEGW